MTKLEKDTSIVCRSLGIKLIHYNPNKLCEKTSDCTTRAISRLLNISWEEAMTLQYKKVLETGVAFNGTSIIKDILKEYGYEEVKVNYSDSFAKFIMEHRKGRYLICDKYHAIACINSKIYDSSFKFYDEFIVRKNIRVYMKI